MSRFAVGFVAPEACAVKCTLRFYHNVIPGSAVAREPFYVAIITPVIHYYMGGRLRKSCVDM